jgi:hypothetical protein
MKHYLVKGEYMVRYTEEEIVVAASEEEAREKFLERMRLEDLGNCAEEHFDWEVTECETEDDEEEVVV